jgi:hypothetical protein
MKSAFIDVETNDKTGWRVLFFIIHFNAVWEEEKVYRNHLRFVFF